MYSDKGGLLHPSTHHGGPLPWSVSCTCLLIGPDDRYAAKCVIIDCHVAEGRDRQMSGHQELAIGRQLPQKFDADARPRNRVGLRSNLKPRSREGCSMSALPPIATAIADSRKRSRLLY